MNKNKQMLPIMAVCAAMFTGTASAEHRIWGGTVSNPKQEKVEFLGYLETTYRGGVEDCSAVLLHAANDTESRWVLTAAHCLVDDENNFHIATKDEIRANLGPLTATTFTYKEQTIKSFTFFNEKWQTSTRDMYRETGRGIITKDDLVLIELKNTIKGIGLSVADIGYEEPISRDNLTVYGYGEIAGNPQSEALHKIQANIADTPNSSCQEFVNYNPKSRCITFGDKAISGQLPGLRFGDSGGPVLENSGGEWRLVGISNGGFIETGRYYYHNAIDQETRNWILKTVK